MADRYWVRNGAATSANTATAWNTLADNTGSTGIPLAGDTVYIGHPDTLALNIGYAGILWDLSLSLTELITYSGYNSASLTSSTIISFTATNTIILSNTNWEDLGFKAGMQIRITGTGILGNTGNFDISNIASNVLTTTQTTLSNEAVGATVTVDASINFQLEASITTQGFTLDTELVNNTGSNNTITFGGTYLSGNKYVHNGANAVIPTASQSLITYTFNTSANGAGQCFFDDGPYPITTTTGNSYFTPEYNTPMSTTHGAATFYSMSLGVNSILQPNASPTGTATQNASKVFEILTTSTFAIGGSVFDAGFSTFAFTMDGHWTVPVTGDTTYGTAPFKSRFYNLIIRTPATAGNKASVPNNRTLSVNSLTVEADAVLVGHYTAGSGATSTVISVRRPTIKGSWNFSQLSDGIYVSLMSDTFPITPSDGPVGRVQLSDAGGIFTSDAKFTWTSATSTLLVDGKLTVTGLIDPTGMEFTAVGANPSAANPAKTIWVNSADSNKLYFGSSAVGGGGGGGGSGTVTSVATSAPITGGTITATGTIGISAATTGAAGSMSSTDKSKLDGIEASADVTDTTNVTAAGALMDSEVTNLAQVKAFDTSDYATSAQGAKADSAQQPPSEGAFANGDKTKLDAIAAGATAYNDAAAIAAVEGKATLALTGQVTMVNGMDITWASGSNLGSNGAGNDLTIYATDDLFLRAVDVVAIKTGAAYAMWVTSAQNIGIGNTTPQAKLDVTGTIRQTASTNAVLVSDANGDIVSASNLTDVPYIPQGQAEADPFPSAHPPDWAGAPPNTIGEAINRIAAQVALMAGPIP
mgnify:CR=1 FL=1